jgi:hypothetical protein
MAQSRYGCPKIAEQASAAFGFEINYDLVRADSSGIRDWRHAAMAPALARISRSKSVLRHFMQHLWREGVGVAAAVG